ncbi:MAG: M6 family metalloprotease domain-containing protein [Promethearchaeota archaeon]
MNRRIGTALLATFACTAIIVGGFIGTAGKSTLPDYQIRMVQDIYKPGDGRGQYPLPYIAPSGDYTGDKKLLVLLLEFTDVSGSHSKTYYENLLFDHGNPLSMASYFWENSYGRLNISGEVVGWLTSSVAMSYYGADSGPFPNIDDANGYIFEMAREAVQLANPTVDFTQYDEDSDGYVDNLVVIHAGSGQERTGVANDIWSHRWNIQPWENVDGKKASAYAVLAENSPVGVFAHEYAHILDLPDMYDYSYSGQVFAGDWSLMDSGSWNGPLAQAGTVPGHLLTWSKMQLGFINASEQVNVGLNEEKTVTILATSDQASPDTGNDEYRVAVVNISNGIYYTVEVRNKSMGTFEEYLPDEGVIISFCNDSARDEVFYGRPGAAVVQNANPSITSKNDAPFDLSSGGISTFRDEDRNIEITLVSKNDTNGAYTVSISHLQLEIEMFYINGTDSWQTFENGEYNLTIELKNTGTTNLTAVQGTLYGPGDGETITQASSNFGTLEPETPKNGSADYHVQLATVGSTPMNFTLNVTYGGSSSSNLSMQIPVQLEATNPTVSITQPTKTKVNASESIPIATLASDNVALFMSWARLDLNTGNDTTGWVKLADNGSHVLGALSTRIIGNHTLTVRVMDTSGNIAEDTLAIEVVDEIAPLVLMTVNGPRGNPATIAVLGNKLTIIVVAIDNALIQEVDIRINNGTYFSIINNTATVEVVGGSGGIARGFYTGYYYTWTPAFEGQQLVATRVSDDSGNITLKSWSINVISQQTIIIYTVIFSVAAIFFIGIGAYMAKKRRGSKYQKLDW